MPPPPRLKAFIFTEKLGKGSYATVFKAFRTGTEREVVAVKCVLKSSLTKSATDNLLTEISILKSVKNKHIVQLKDFQWDDHYIYLIMEYCGGGDLSKFIQQKRQLPEMVVQRFLQQLAIALQVLRRHNICHMDLKPQNILLSSVHNPILKLADFGFAQYLCSEDEATTLRGSPLYMAPEILLHHHYDARVDLWSVGIILYECLFGRAPFSSETFAELVEKIKSKKSVEIPYGVEVSDACRSLLLGLLQRDVEKRITFDEFFAHPFIDLDHTPSIENYAKGVQLIQKATNNDSCGNLQRAWQQYCEGVMFLLPVMHDEIDKIKQDALKEKIKCYLQRAEEIKCLLEANRRPSQTEDIPELVKLSAVNSIVSQALKNGHTADEMMAVARYEDALTLYQASLEQMVKIAKGNPNKEKLYKEIDGWMCKAEEAKSCLMMQKLQVKEIVNAVGRGDRLSDISSGLGTPSNCNLQ